MATERRMPAESAPVGVVLAMGAALVACGPGDPADAGPCPELVLEGEVRAETIEELEGLPRYTRVEGVGLWRVPGLTDLRAFECLQSADFLYLGSMEDLRSLRGLERVLELDQVLIFNGHQLESLEGLDGLVRVAEQIIIEENPVLRTIGLRALEEVPSLRIGWVDFGPYLDGEGTPPFCSSAPGNPSLVELDGLDSLRGFQRIQIKGNDNLESVDILATIAARAEQVLPIGSPPWADDNFYEGPPTITFQGNAKLSREQIEDLWSEVGPDGAPYRYCGTVEEVCRCEP
jgi:hypothetical protein